MAEAIGLSIGASRFAGVQLGRAALTRPVTAGVVERVGDPVGLLAADGSVHRAEILVADILRELLLAVNQGRPSAKPAVIAYPAHWRKTQVDALRAVLPRFTLISDAAASISALQSDPGVPARGVIVLCDFGGTGTSVTLLDASRGYAPLGPTLRNADFSGDFIDQALTTHVVADMPATSTSALGQLHRVRGQCRDAKETLSSAAVATLTGGVRVTRAELDELIRTPLSDFVEDVQETLDRNGIHRSRIAAVVSTGGGARIPIITTTLSERFRVPVITTARPELAPATGAALRAARGPGDDRPTAIVPVVAAARPPVFADADAHSANFRALAWSEAPDVRPVAKPVRRRKTPKVAAPAAARPVVEFVAPEKPAPVARRWYRSASTLASIAATLIVLVAACAVIVLDSDPPSQDQPRTVYVAPAPDSP